ncbi:helix-turn-helix domain-containing protein [Vibrio brasiliensis]|uniref:helix-turn-helix domain-containing protein n=1 Tax=Vibrio brasiliensis TaxID=170652 RepID=UPI001EFCFAE9|nr:helix-turn-helix transcriptional regulator [Vibrio brasiliensis]MCG9781540.1 helix-turn-helix domain-containing protein [Vibrio brasiliensis]
MQFGKLLKSQRLDRGFSQNNLLKELAKYHESFSNLDINTISRWERGLSKPTKKRQILIARFFNITNFNMSQKMESKLYSFQEADVSGYSDPYSSSTSGIEVIDLKYNRDSDYESYCHLIDTFNDNIYLSNEIKTIDLLENSNVLHSFIYKSKYSILGHCIIAVSNLAKILTLNGLDDLFSYLYKSDELCDTDDTVFVPTYYSRNYKCENFSIFHVCQIILQNKNIKRAVICIHSKHSLEFFLDQLDARIIKAIPSSTNHSRSFKIRGKLIDYAFIEVDAINAASYSYQKFTGNQGTIDELSYSHYYIK